jgi:hypothetical protein
VGRDRPSHTPAWQAAPGLCEGGLLAPSCQATSGIEGIDTDSDTDAEGDRLLFLGLFHAFADRRTA